MVFAVSSTYEQTHQAIIFAGLWCLTDQRLASLTYNRAWSNFCAARERRRKGQKDNA
jgi:hypothetical protein